MLRSQSRDDAHRKVLSDMEEKRLQVQSQMEMVRSKSRPRSAPATRPPASFHYSSHRQLDPNTDWSASVRSHRAQSAGPGARRHSLSAMSRGGKLSSTSQSYLSSSSSQSKDWSLNPVHRASSMERLFMYHPLSSVPTACPSRGVARHASRNPHQPRSTRQTYKTFLTLQYKSNDATITQPHQFKFVQHRPGSCDLTVFEGGLYRKEVFSIISTRAENDPLGITVFKNGLLHEQFSACCEHKYSPGTQLGGRTGSFLVVSVTGATPCAECLNRRTKLSLNKRSSSAKIHRPSKSATVRGNSQRRSLSLSSHCDEDERDYDKDPADNSSYKDTSSLSASKSLETVASPKHILHSSRPTSAPTTTRYSKSSPTVRDKNSKSNRTHDQPHDSGTTSPQSNSDCEGMESLPNTINPNSEIPHQHDTADKPHEEFDALWTRLFEAEAQQLSIMPPRRSRVVPPKTTTIYELCNDIVTKASDPAQNEAEDAQIAIDMWELAQEQARKRKLQAAFEDARIHFEKQSDDSNSIISTSVNSTHTNTPSPVSTSTVEVDTEKSNELLEESVGISLSIDGGDVATIRRENDVDEQNLSSVVPDKQNKPSPLLSSSQTSTSLEEQTQSSSSINDYFRNKIEGITEDEETTASSHGVVSLESSTHHDKGVRDGDIVVENDETMSSNVAVSRPSTLLHTRITEEEEPLSPSPHPNHPELDFPVDDNWDGLSDTLQDSLTSSGYSASADKFAESDPMLSQMLAQLRSDVESRVKQQIAQQVQQQQEEEQEREREREKEPDQETEPNQNPDQQPQHDHNIAQAQHGDSQRIPQAYLNDQNLSHDVYNHDERGGGADNDQQDGSVLRSAVSVGSLNHVGREETSSEDEDSDEELPALNPL